MIVPTCPVPDLIRGLPLSASDYTEEQKRQCLEYFSKLPLHSLRHKRELLQAKINVQTTNHLSIYHQIVSLAIANKNRSTNNDRYRIAQGHHISKSY